MELNPSQMLGPFLEAVSQVQQEAEKAANLPLAPSQREVLEALSSELRSHRARFEEFAPLFIQMAGRQIQENRQQMEVLLRRKDDLLVTMEDVSRQADEAIALADRTLADRSEKPMPVAPRPKTCLPEKATSLPLTPGGQLRDLLTSERAPSQPPTRQLKRIGNIWEDWAQKAIPTESPSSEEFPEEEDGGASAR